jgi:hypothetical protein
VGVSTAVGNGNVTIVFLSFTHAKGPNMGRFVLNTATGASTMYFSVKQQLQYLLTQRKLPINNTPPTVANIMRNVAHVDIITIDPLLAGAAGRGAGGWRSRVLGDHSCGDSGRGRGASDGNTC